MFYAGDNPYFYFVDAVLNTAFLSVQILQAIVLCLIYAYVLWTYFAI